jgi:hypothetical protein
MAGNLAAEVSDLKVRVAEIAPVVQRMEKDLYNCGNGMLVLFTRFVASHEAHEYERDKTLADQRDAVKDDLKEHNKRADRRVNVLIAVCAIIMAVYAIPQFASSLIKLRKEILSNELYIPAWITPMLTHTDQLNTAHSTTPPQIATE